MKNTGARILIDLILQGFHPKEEGLFILERQHGIRGAISEDGKSFTGWDSQYNEMIDITLLKDNS